MVREYIRGRWVMVELKNGQFFIASVAALTDIDKDERVTKPFQPLTFGADQ